MQVVIRKKSNLFFFKIKMYYTKNNIIVKDDNIKDSQYILADNLVTHGYGEDKRIRPLIESDDDIRKSQEEIDTLMELLRNTSSK